MKHKILGEILPIWTLPWHGCYNKTYHVLKYLLLNLKMCIIIFTWTETTLLTATRFKDSKESYIRLLQWREKILSLKRLKYKFAKESRIAETHLTKITKSKQIANDDDKGLIEFYYSLSDCVITLRQLNYESDTYSADTLCQTIHRFSNKFYARWVSTHCLSVKHMREPRLVDMETWLHKLVNWPVVTTKTS